MANPSGPRAGFGRRLGAYLIDVIILLVVYAFLARFVNEALAGAVYVLGGIAYFVYCEGSESGQTLGKSALGIRVYDLRAGGPIGYGRAILRYIGRILSSLPCLLGYLWMLWDGERQTWHDKIAGSVVVPTSHYPLR